GTDKLQLVYRRPEVGFAMQVVPVYRHCLAGSAGRSYQLWRKPVFRRAWDKCHRTDALAQLATGSQHLELKLRYSPAEIVDRKPLEHHIGNASIGGCIPCTLLSLDQRIGCLRLVTSVDTDIEILEVEFPTVRPYPTHPCNLTIANSKRHIGEIRVGRLFRSALAPLPRSRASLLEARPPDQRAPNPHRPVNTRQG